MWENGVQWQQKALAAAQAQRLLPHERTPVYLLEADTDRDRKTEEAAAEDEAY